jgi:protein TonB
MGTTNTSGNSLNEIVFENRNKSYGAYAIRKSYDDALIKSFTIAMMALLALIGSFRLMHAAEAKAMTIPIDPPKPFNPFNPPSGPKIKTTICPPVRSTAAPKSTTVDYTKIEDSTKLKPRQDSILNTNKPSGTGAPGSLGIGLTDHPGLIDSSGNKKEAGGEFVHDWVEVMPEFPGGEKKMQQYLSRNIRFTNKALNFGRDGNMLLRFVVDVDGSIKNIEVIKKYGFGCEEQAMQVVSEMPKWKPGRMGKTAVPVYFTLPIVYHMER